MTDLPARGEVWWCELAEIGRRPVVVLSRDAVIPRHRRALIAPCTTTVRGLPSEVLLEPGDDPVPLRSVVNLDSIESVSTAILVERLGRVAEARMLRSAPPSQWRSTAQAEPAAHRRSTGLSRGACHKTIPQIGATQIGGRRTSERPARPAR